MSFPHLEVHSHFSLLRALPTIEQLVERAASEGLAQLALTDTNALHGAVGFSKACLKAGIRPILGLTVEVASPPDLEPDRSGPTGDADAQGHLVLLAKGPLGYRSLCRISSLILAPQPGYGQSDAAASRSRQGLRWDELQANSDGLICLSGGRMGLVERYLRSGDSQAARLCAARLAGIFGDDAGLAVEIHSISDQAVAAEIVALGARLGVPAVASQPVYCLEPHDSARLRLLAAIRLNCPLDAVPASALPDGGDDRVAVHWHSPAQLLERFASLPALRAALEMARTVAERCEASLPDGRPIWPVLKLPAGETPAEALERLAAGGLAEKYGANPGAEIRLRLGAELATIAEHGYAPLFLVVADLVAFARRQDIPVSTRGSVANSLVAYCTGITTVDPIEHGLMFERFLNPARSDPPDIDLDLCSERRDEVLEYVRRTYGPEHVALIGTINTMRPQSAVRETAKAYRIPAAQVDRVVASLPHQWHPDPRRRDRRTMDDVLTELEDPRLREVVRAAYTLVGQPDHLGVHPGGVVITPGPLTDVVPLQWAPKGFVVTQLDHGSVEALGLPKIDLLGLRALTVLADSAGMVRRAFDPGFRLDQIPLDDPATAAILARGDTIGVFQCESYGAQRTLRKLRARSVRDLAVANAFFKPGPSTGGMAGAFVRRYRGEEAVTFLHPALAPILGPTKGVLIFQEQVLRIATEVAGLTWAQADHLRRGMSKFRGGEMAELQEQFTQGCRRPPPEGPGMPAAQAQTLWDQVIAFAGYGFNQGHATAYADVSYRSGYLRAHYPAPFLCARLANWGGFHHPAIYMAEAQRLGMRVRPPHVNHSEEQFALELAVEPKDGEARPATLWMGLGQVRDLRSQSIAQIVSVRAADAYDNLAGLVSRVELQPKEVEHLIKCGALDGLGESRSAMLADAAGIRQSGSVLQMAFVFAREPVTAEPPSRRLAWENHILGLPVSVNPLDLVGEEVAGLTPLRRLPERGGVSERTAGFRLPGWTGGPGYFVGDGDSYIIVRAPEDQKAPAPWHPLLLVGRWQTDAWGSSWFAADSVTALGGAAV